MSDFPLIIFDCDGTLVDTETLYNTITAELLNEMGFAEYTPEICIERFAGQSWSSIHAMLEAEHGTVIPRDIVTRYVEIANERMKDDLRPSPYAHDLVTLYRDKNHKICVGSNGERRSVVNSLKLSGLYDHFGEERIFTKIQVERPKPAPDLFLFVADQMKENPANTLVLEDSPAGVEAGRAAGMHVIGYVGTSHDKQKQEEKLLKAGADRVIQCLSDLL